MIYCNIYNNYNNYFNIIILLENNNLCIKIEDIVNFNNYNFSISENNIKLYNIKNFETYYYIIKNSLEKNNKYNIELKIIKDAINLTIYLLNEKIIDLNIIIEKKLLLEDEYDNNTVKNNFISEDTYDLLNIFCASCIIM